MIPFNQLGPVFKVFASMVYPGSFRKELASVVEELAPEGNILDVGSGTGILTRFSYEVRKDLRYTMIDPAPGMLRFAPDFAKKVIGRAEKMPFPSEWFDAVFMGDSFHHFDEPDRAVKEFLRVLKNGGVMVIFEIDPKRYLGAFIHRIEKIFREPSNFYHPEQLADMLAKNGLSYTISKYDWRYSVTARK